LFGVEDVSAPPGFGWLFGPVLIGTGGGDGKGGTGPKVTGTSPNLGPVLVGRDGAGVPVPGVGGLLPVEGVLFVPDGEVVPGVLCLPPVDGDELLDDEVEPGFGVGRCGNAHDGPTEGGKAEREDSGGASDTGLDHLSSFSVSQGWLGEKRIKGEPQRNLNAPLSVCSYESQQTAMGQLGAVRLLTPM